MNYHFYSLYTDDGFIHGGNAMWLCHIPTLYHYVIFPPGGNMTGGNLLWGHERMSVLHQDSGGIRKSIPSALEISLGHRFCTPRPSGFPSGFALGKSLGSRGAKPMAAGNLSRFPSTLEISLGLRPREISWVSGNLGRRGWIFQSLPPLGGARIQWKLEAEFRNFEDYDEEEEYA